MTNYLDGQEWATMVESANAHTADELADFNEKYKGILKEDYKEFFTDQNLKMLLNILILPVLTLIKVKNASFLFCLTSLKKKLIIIEAKKNRREFLKELTDKAVDNYARNFNYRAPLKTL